MEVVSIFVFTTAVAAIGGCIAIARKQAWKVSPVAIEVEMPISEVFAKIHKKMKEPLVAPPSWFLKDSLENVYIIADLDYRDERITCSGMVHIDFADQVHKLTKIRWTCESKQQLGERDINSIQGYISDWIKLVLFPPPPAKIQTEWSNTLLVSKPLQYCFSKMLDRLSNTNDAAHQWELIDIETNGKISSRLQHIELHNKKLRCAANVDFEFAEDGKKTNLRWTYQITQAKSDTDSESLRYLTDEWIKLIFVV